MKEIPDFVPDLAVWFETGASYRGRPILAAFDKHFLKTREKGRQQEFALPWPTIHETAMKVYARENAAEERKRR